MPQYVSNPERFSNLDLIRVLLEHTLEKTEDLVTEIQDSKRKILPKKSTYFFNSLEARKIIPGFYRPDCPNYVIIRNEKTGKVTVFATVKKITNALDLDPSNVDDIRAVRDRLAGFHRKLWAARLRVFYDMDTSKGKVVYTKTNPGWVWSLSDAGYAIFKLLTDKRRLAVTNEKQLSDILYRDPDTLQRVMRKDEDLRRSVFESLGVIDQQAVLEAKKEAEQIKRETDEKDRMLQRAFKGMTKEHADMVMKEIDLIWAKEERTGAELSELSPVLVRKAVRRIMQRKGLPPPPVEEIVEESEDLIDDADTIVETPPPRIPPPRKRKALPPPKKEGPPKEDWRTFLEEHPEKEEPRREEEE